MRRLLKARFLGQDSCDIATLEECPIMITLEMLEPVFREVFDDIAIVLQRETSANDIEDWDSLTHMNLAVAMELRFRIRFALGELQKLKNVGEMLDLINRKLAK